MLIKPHDAVFLVNTNPGRLRVVSCQSELVQLELITCEYSFGAVFTAWRRISDSEIYPCIQWTGLEIADAYNVPASQVRDELEKIEDYLEYANRLGALSGAL